MECKILARSCCCCCCCFKRAKHKGQAWDDRDYYIDVSIECLSVSFSSDDGHSRLYSTGGCACGDLCCAVHQTKLTNDGLSIYTVSGDGGGGVLASRALWRIDL